MALAGSGFEVVGSIGPGTGIEEAPVEAEVQMRSSQEEEKEA